MTRWPDCNDGQAVRAWLDARHGDTDQPGPRTLAEFRKRQLQKLGRAMGEDEPREVDMSELVVKADSRGRVPLIRAGIEKGARYVVTVEGDGTIRLVPAVVVSEPKAQRAFGAEGLRRLREPDAPFVSAEDALGAAVDDLADALAHNAAHRELATLVEPSGLDAFFDSLAREE